MRLRGRTAIITGAARGIGRACALRFSAEGADLALLDIGADVAEIPYRLGSAEQLEHTAELCRSNGASVVTFLGDIRSDTFVDRVAERTVDRFGAVDILINNAGVVAPAGVDVHELSTVSWATVIDINLSGAWRLIRSVVPLMLERNRGSVVNIASTAGLVGYRKFSAYVASKHGLIGLTRAAALDYVERSIRVNAVCPGSIRDDPELDGCMLAEISHCLGLTTADYATRFAESQPGNTLMEPASVADAALWLAIDESAQVTGSVVTVDGGYSIR